MSKIQKVLTLAVAGAIVATSMSGCGGKKKTNPVAPKTETVIGSDSDSQYAQWKDNTKVRAAIDSKDFNTAISLTTSRIEEDPGDARAHFLLGQALLAKGDLVRARKSLEAAVKLAPDSGNYQVELNRCLAAMADSAIELDIPSEAIDLLKKLLKDKYQVAQTEKKLGDVYARTSKKLIETGNVSEAETLLREAAGLLPDIPEVKVELAELLIESDRLMEAERLLKSVREINPTDVSGMIASAKLHHRMGEISKSAEMIEKALKADPQNEKAMALKASFTRDVPAVTVATMPETDLNLETWLEKLRLYEKTNNLGEQRTILEYISRNFTDEPWATFKLSTVYEKLGMLDEAMLTIEDFLRSQPDSLKGQLHFARCLYQKGEHGQALEILDRIEPTFPDKLEILGERGQVMARMGNFAQARVLWQQIIQADPEHTATLFNFGQLEMESGNHAEAADYFEKAIRKEPFNNKFRYFAGLNLIQNGEKDKAHSLWEASKASLNIQDPYAARILKALGDKTGSESTPVVLSAPPPTIQIPSNVAGFAGSKAETIIIPGRTADSMADPNYERALEFARGGYFAEAIEAFREVLSHNPGNFNALMNLGKVYTATGKQQLAAAWYLKALKLDPRNIHALKALANSYADIGMHSLASQITDQVKASNPDQIEGFPKYTRSLIKNDPRGIEPLAAALIEEGLNSEALAVVQSGIAQQSDIAVLYLLQGDVFKTMGQYQQALESYQTGLNKEPQSPAPFIRIGDLYLASGQTTAAIEEYKKALKVNFIDPDSMFTISDRLAQAGREVDARTVLSRIKGMNLNNEQLKKLDLRLGTNLSTQIQEGTQ